ncbi:unnamed protein product [marine sediment metagenome]|uniref:Uncharacterized protein n=1 Tax=marine sediment metagenome TaxID=412755 RepID=X1EMK9_9ZZZZ
MAVSSIIQWYFFALDRIEKVDNIEEQVKSYYEERKVKQEASSIWKEKSD